MYGYCSGQLYTYDVENRIALVPQYPQFTQYAYAPGNKRVWRGAQDGNGNTTLDEVTFWSVSGQKLATYNLSAGRAAYQNNTWVLTLYALWGPSNVYFGGKLIGHNGDYSLLVTDRLGSIGKYYPWGQEKPSATTNGTEKFTGYFRDAKTGLDYADQRYHQPGMGRFLTADPYGNSAGPTDPGSWNRYAYVG
jgi:RHS repeat-associated protein